MAGLSTYLKSVWKVVHKRSNVATVRRDQLKNFLPYLRNHRVKIGLGMLLMIIVSLVSLPIPYFTKVLIDDVFPKKNFVMLHIITLIVLLLYFGRVILSFLMNYLFALLNQDIQVSIRKNLFYRLMRLPLSFYTKQQTGYLLARLQEVQGLNTFFSSSMMGLAVNVLEFLFVILILFYLNWKLTCIALLILPVYFFVVRFLSLGLRTSSLDFMETTAQLSRNMQESLTGINVIKTFSAEERETMKIHKSLANYFRTGVLQSIFLSFSSEFVLFIGALGTTAILWFSGLKIMQGQFTVGLYVAFAGYLGKLYAPTQKFASMGIILQPAIVALSRISELFAVISEDEDGKRLVEISKLQGEIRFENVTFRYDDGKNVLHDINFQIEPGQKVAIVGPSGVGKTTLVSLILQLYKPKVGKIYLDGVDAATIRLLNLRERIGIVSQDVFLFDDSIKNNIRYGRPDASDEEVLLASKMAYAHAFIENLPARYDTLVGERGIKLSAGQKQRISIARTILYDPDVLIFDEATSDLDALSERAIREFIFSKNSGKTIIIIAHRFSTISSVDLILVLDKGRIKQQGHPGDLMHVEGPYRILYEAQKTELS